MNTRNSRRWALLVFVLLPLVAASCKSDAPSSSTATPEGVTVEGEISVGTGPFGLLDPAVGLAELPAYQGELTLSFDGTRAGQPSQWTKIYTMQWSKEPAARQFTVESSGDLPDLTQIFMAEQGGVSYERRGESLCLGNPLSEGSPLAEVWEPAGLLPWVLGADDAGTDRVNEVASDHYTFDERALGEEGRISAEGELWVASEGDYLVRYLLTINGDENYFGEEGVEGILMFAYELTVGNQVPATELPADCPPGLVEAPLLADAANVQSLPGVLSFDSAMSLAEVVEFYQQQLSELGWAQNWSSVQDATARLAFLRGNETLTVIITSNGGITEVRILAGRAGS